MNLSQFISGLLSGSWPPSWVTRLSSLLASTAQSPRGQYRQHTLLPGALYMCTVSWPRVSVTLLRDWWPWPVSSNILGSALLDIIRSANGNILNFFVDFQFCFLPGESEESSIDILHGQTNAHIQIRSPSSWPLPRNTVRDYVMSGVNCKQLFPVKE